MDILADTTNIAARAGMMCAQIGQCSVDKQCSSLRANVFSGTGSAITGGLDLCAAEGVAGGTDTALPSVTVTPDTCVSSSNCTTGKVCYIPDDGSYTDVCACVDGEDVCYTVGTCTSYCALASTVQQVTRLNAGAKACTPGAEETGCDDGDTCAPRSVCQSWACDAASASLVSVTCSGKCRPNNLSPTSARISNDGTSVVVTLNAYAVTLTNARCATVLDASSLELVGSSALCSTSDNTLTIKLASTAKLQVGSSLTLLATGSALVAQVDESAFFTGTVTVATCTKCVAPKASLTGPAAVAQPCSGGGLLSVAGSLPPSFDGSLSSDPSGRSTWSNVQWDLDASVGLSSGQDVLRAAVDRANAYASPNDRLVLGMLASEVTSLAEASYRFKLTVTSWLGTSTTTTLTFDKTAGATKPAVKVVGPSVQSFRISTGVRVSASAGSTCGKTVDWLWTAPSPWSGMPTAGVAAQNLFRPGPSPALHGQSVLLRVAGSFTGVANSQATDDVSMSAVGATPSASLKGPSGDVPDDSTLVFTATGSTDPDASSTASQKLDYKWECKREDFPAPCFTTSDEGDKESTKGVWRLSPSLLTLGKKHTITVTVTKTNVMKGSTPLKATASATFKPRSAAEPFPRGTLTRQCSAADCAYPHSTDKDLTLMLVLDSKYTDASVSWSSTEASTVSSLTPSAIATGTYLLVIPADDLPSGLTSLTVTASLLLNGLDGSAIVSVPLNDAPYCSLDEDNPSTCVKVDLAADTFPTAVATLRAQGWADDQDTQLTYEFGIRTSSGDSPQSIGVATSSAVVGLSQGNVTLYVCAKDSSNARTCGTVVVTIKPPGADFDAGSMLSGLDLSSLSSDPAEVLQAAAQVSLLSAYISSASASPPPSPSPSGASSKASDAQITTASNQAISLINGILSSSNLADSQQAQLALSGIANIANSNAGLLNAAAQTLLLSATSSIATALLTSGSADSVTAASFLTLLNAAAPDATSATQLSALEWLRQLLRQLDKLAKAMGRVAVPGATYTPTGTSGVFLSVAAPPTASAGSSVSLTVRAGAGAKALASTASSRKTSTGRRRLVSSASSVSLYGRSSQHQLNPRGTLAAAWEQQHHQHGPVEVSRRQRALQQSTAALSAVTAEASLVLSGSAATGASGYSVGWAYAPVSEPVIPVALGGAKPGGVDLRGGLAYLVWSAVGSDAAASPPSLDGSSSYIRMAIPAPGYDATKLGTCVLYDVMVANTLSGTLAELVSGSAPATFEKYEGGRVWCKASAPGVYVVAQNQQSILPSPPPPSANPPSGSTPGGGSNPGGAPGVSSPPPPLTNNTQAGPGPGAGAGPSTDPNAPSATPAPGTVPSPPAGGVSGSGKKGGGAAGAAAGGVVAGVAVIAIAVAVFLYLRRRRAKVAAEPSGTSQASAEAGAANVEAPAQAAVVWTPAAATGSPAGSRAGSRAGSATAATLGAAAAATAAAAADPESAPESPRSARSTRSSGGGGVAAGARPEPPGSRLGSSGGSPGAGEARPRSPQAAGSPAGPLSPRGSIPQMDRPGSGRPPRSRSASVHLPPPPSAAEAALAAAAGAAGGGGAAGQSPQPRTPVSARSARSSAAAAFARSPSQEPSLGEEITAFAPESHQTITTTASNDPLTDLPAPPPPVRPFRRPGDLVSEGSFAGSVGGGRKGSWVAGMDFEMPHTPRAAELEAAEAPVAPNVTLEEVAAAVAAAAADPSTAPVEVLRLSRNASLAGPSPREPASIGGAGPGPGSAGAGAGAGPSAGPLVLPLARPGSGLRPGSARSPALQAPQWPGLEDLVGYLPMPPTHTTSDAGQGQGKGPEGARPAGSR